MAAGMAQEEPHTLGERDGGDLVDDTYHNLGGDRRVGANVAVASADEFGGVGRAGDLKEAVNNQGAALAAGNDFAD